MTIRDLVTMVFALIVSMGSVPAMASVVSAERWGEVLEVKTEPEMFQGDAHRGWVEERGEALLAKGSYAFSEGDRIVVELGGLAYGYRVKVTAFHDGQALAPEAESLAFEGSTEELLPRIDAEIEAAAKQLVAVAEAEAAAQAEEDERRQQEEEARAEAQAAADAAESARAQRRKKAKRMTIVGASLVSVGGAGLVTGVGLIAAPPREYPDDNRLQTTLRPPGFVVLGVGAVTAVAGASVLVWNHLRCRKAPADCGAESGSETARHVVPWVGGHGGGASFVGRF